MLQSIKQLYGTKLGASDGEFGHVKDFYFDDQNWTIRYVVADTGSWLAGRQVLISPHAIGRVFQIGGALKVNLTRKQIEQCPPIGAHKPVSRQYEEEYHRYYGWPFYWDGSGLWGMSGFPILELPEKPFLGELDKAGSAPVEPADAHLCSTQAVKGYNLQASVGILGHVSDFLMNEESWSIDQLVARTGHRLSGAEVEIPSSCVDRIGYDESTVFVKLSKEEVERSAPHLAAPAGSAH